MATTMSAITLNSTDPVRTATFWAALLDGSWSHGGNGFVHVHGGALLLIVQPAPDRVPPAATDVHLDLRADDPAAAVQRALGLGATLVAARSDSHGSWTVLRDPDGRELCIA
jgi:hypothetical protein